MSGMKLGPGGYIHHIRDSVLYLRSVTHRLREAPEEGENNEHSTARGVAIHFP